MIKLPIPTLDGLTTERLMFRRPVAGDASWWMEYMNDPGSIRFMPFTLGSSADCAFFLQRSLDRLIADGSGLHAVLLKGTERPVGMIGLLTQQVDELDELEVGYHLLPSATGNGYAAEAAAACKAFAQRHELAPSVISLIDPGNVKSQAVARRNGMHFEKNTVHRGVPAMVFRATF